MQCACPSTSRALSLSSYVSSNYGYNTGATRYALDFVWLLVLRGICGYFRAFRVLLVLVLNLR